MIDDPSSTTAVLNAALASENRPIFGRRQINHSPPHPVTQLVAANGKIVLVLQNKSVQRFDITGGGGTKPETVDLGLGSKHKPDGAFLDPTGDHLVISLRPNNDPEAFPDFVYLNRRSIKPKMSSKGKNHLVSAMAWDTPDHITSDSTGVALIGTALGLVFETELVDPGQDKAFINMPFKSSNLEKRWQQVLDLRGKDKKQSPVTGIQFYRASSTGRTFVLATTPTRLYRFSGNASGAAELGGEFSILNVIGNLVVRPLIEQPSSLKYSLLSYGPKLVPGKYAWVTDRQVWTGVFDFATKSGHAVGEVGEVLPLPEVTPSSENQEDKYPNSLVLTDFHALLSYPDRVVGVSLLNKGTMFVDDFKSAKKIRGMAKDLTKGKIYAFSEYDIFEYPVEREERNVWRDYLFKAQTDPAFYQLALKYCQGDEEKMNEVYSRQAEDKFEKGQHEQSALLYAKTKKGFEEVALKFLPLPDKAALLTFLKNRLEVVKPDEKTQVTMLVVWLFEIYLNLMSGTTSQHRRARDQVIDGVEEVAETALTSQTSDEMFRLMEMPKVRETVANNRVTFYELLESHGDKENMVKFGKLLQDYDYVVKLYLQDGQYGRALEMLESQRRTFDEKDPYYKYGPLMMPQIPKRFIDSVKRQKGQLKPALMIPALVVASTPEQELEAIRYLEFCIEERSRGGLGSCESVIHNFLLSLYVKHSESGEVKVKGEVKILQYLERHFVEEKRAISTSGVAGRGGDDDIVSVSFDRKRVHFDVNYVLRLCSEKAGEGGQNESVTTLQLRKACVKLHCMLGQYEQAVELALQDDTRETREKLDLAKFCLKVRPVNSGYGGGPGDDDDEMERSRRIWLRLARYVVEKEQDIKQAMKFLEQCQGLVKIEDILPFFPDFVIIDDFKGAICDSLQEYSQNIAELQTEMEGAYDDARAIREEIQKFKSRHILAKASDKCAMCKGFLLTRPFHLFVCGHKFHTECLIAAVKPHLSPARLKKLKELRAVIEGPEEAVASGKNGGPSGKEADTVSTCSLKMSRKDQARTELDDLIASECPFCGEIMIKMIDKPFIQDHEFSAVMEKWL